MLPNFSLFHGARDDTIAVGNFGLGRAFTPIIEGLKNSTKSLHHIEVQNNRLDDRALADMLAAVDHAHKEVVSLNLSGNQAGGATCKHLANIISPFSSRLTDLNLSKMSIGDDELLTHSLGKGIAANFSITKLDLSHNRLGNTRQRRSSNHTSVDDAAAAAAPGSALAAAVAGNGRIIHLDLSWNAIRGPAAVLLANAMEDNDALTELNLCMNKFGKTTWYLEYVVV